MELDARMKAEEERAMTKPSCRCNTWKKIPKMEHARKYVSLYKVVRQ